MRQKVVSPTSNPSSMVSSEEQSDPSLPPKPVPPEANECCGRGCEPCIHDYYELALQRWEEKVKAIYKGSVKEK